MPADVVRWRVRWCCGQGSYKANVLAPQRRLFGVRMSTLSRSLRSIAFETLFAGLTSHCQPLALDRAQVSPQILYDSGFPADRVVIENRPEWRNIKRERGSALSD